MHWSSAAHRLSSNSVFRVPIKTCFDGKRTSSGATELSSRLTEANGCEACEDARQVLHGLDESLDLPAPISDLIDLLDDCVALSLGILIPADQRVAALVVFFLVLQKASIAVLKVLVFIIFMNCGAQT